MHKSKQKIQEKVKEGFDNVAETVKNVDYEKYGSQAKKGAQGFFKGLGDVLMFILKLFAKFFGILFIISGATVVIALFITVITTGTIELFHPGFTSVTDLIETTDAPAWITLTLFFFAFAIPFFFLFYLGLKIVSNNLKSLSLSLKLGLFALWLAATIALGVLSINHFAAYQNTGKDVSQTELNIKKNDTLMLRMQGSKEYDIPFGRSERYIQIRSTDDNKLLLSRNVRLIVRNTKEATGYIAVEKRANGITYETARNQAQRITYEFDQVGNELFLDGFFTSSNSRRYGDQEVRVIIYLPEGSHLYADMNTRSYHLNDSRYRDLLDKGNEEKFLLMKNRKLVCDDCRQDDNESWSSDDDNSWEYRSYENEDETPDWEKSEDNSTPSSNWKKDSINNSSNNWTQDSTTTNTNG